MGRTGLIRSSIIAAFLLVCMGAQPGMAANRRGAKLYPDKETTADMSGMNRIFIGWVDFREDDYALHGYTNKADWTAHVLGLNQELQRLCQSKYLVGKTVEGAKSKGDENVAGYDLYLKFSDVLIDYSKYHLYVSIHFIDPKTNNEIGSIPTRPYFGNDWGLVNYLKNAEDELSQKIKVEIMGGAPAEKKKLKIPLIHHKD